jgi:hypothetical protein
LVVVKIFFSYFRRQEMGDRPVIQSMKICSKGRCRFKNLPREVQKYLFNLDKKCQKHNIQLILGGGQSVNFGSGRCGGYFDECGKVLKVAIGGTVDSVLCTALHEESHLDQWKNPQSIWHDYKIYNGYNRFFYHINGGRIYKQDHAVQAAIALERDCERLAIKKIRAKWMKYVNLDEYIANSNAYLFSYLYMAEKRKWPSKTPCESKFREHCQTKLLRSHKKIPHNLRKAFDRWL